MALLTATVVLVLVLGPLTWLRRASTLPSGWHPLLVLCSGSLLVLVSGLLGRLMPGVLLAVGLSLVLAVRETALDRRALLRTVRDPAVASWAVSVVVLALALRGQVVTHYDNFSHWALVVAVMLEDGRLPTGADTVVGFPTYPLGAASLSYLANRVVGVAESSSMLAQSLFVASAALPLVSATRRRWPLGVVLYVTATLVLLTTISGPTNLLVDSLVGALAGALLVLVLAQDDVVPHNPWAVALLTVALFMTKASGVLFVLVATVVLLTLLVSRRARLGPARRAAWAAALAAPWLCWWWWGRHVRGAFPDAGSSKHSGSSEHLSATWASMSPEDRREILGQLAAAVAGDLRLWLLLALLLLTGAVAVRCGGLTVGRYRLLLGTSAVTVLLWEVSLALVYLLSMPLPEARVLAGFQRYQETLHLVLVLLGLTLAARAVGASSRMLGAAPVAAVLAVLVVLPMAHPSGLRPPPGSRDQARSTLEGLLEGASVAPEDEVCLLLEEDDKGYRRWMARYLLLHREVTSAVLPEGATGLPGRLDTCDLLVVLDERDSTARAVRADGLSWPADEQAPAMIEP